MSKKRGENLGFYRTRVLLSLVGQGVGLVLEYARAWWYVANTAICQNRKGDGREFSNHPYFTEERDSDKVQHCHHKYTYMMVDFSTTVVTKKKKISVLEKK